MNGILIAASVLWWILALIWLRAVLLAAFGGKLLDARTTAKRELDRNRAAWRPTPGETERLETWHGRYDAAFRITGDPELSVSAADNPTRLRNRGRVVAEVDNWALREKKRAWIAEDLKLMQWASNKGA